MPSPPTTPYGRRPNLNRQRLLRVGAKLSKGAQKTGRQDLTALVIKKRLAQGR